MFRVIVFSIVLALGSSAVLGDEYGGPIPPPVDYQQGENDEAEYDYGPYPPGIGIPEDSVLPPLPGSLPYRAYPVPYPPPSIGDLR